MDIVDYKQRAEVAEKFVFSDPQISQQNKDALRRFLNAYDVSPARRAVFLKHIIFLLRATKDITTEMHDRDSINIIFKKFRAELKAGYLATILNVSLRFVKWLNDGEKPKGFKDIKNISKIEQCRDLSSDDMITWDEGLLVAQQFNNTQHKAMFLTQLDAGFRPGDFYGLNYGDVSVNRDLGVVTFVIKNGSKKADRIVPCQRCVPHILRWLDEHPLKEKNSPLWIIAKNKGFIRYNHDQIVWLFHHAAEKINFKKPVDLYALRHSSCTLDKNDNVPVELASERHGHTAEYYIQTYGRLAVKDKINRFVRHYNNITDDQKLNNRSCSICGHINSPKDEFCVKCQRPLSLQKALEMQNNDREENTKIKQDLENMRKRLNTSENFDSQVKNLLQMLATEKHIWNEDSQRAFQRVLMQRFQKVKEERI